MSASAPSQAQLTPARRLTAQRRLVAEALSDAARTVGAIELFESLRARHPRIGRATVFRTLDLLVEMGLAQRFEGDGHVHLYTSCKPAHHHHLVCRTCGSSEDVDDPEVESLMGAMRRRHGFIVDHGSLDFYGRCARCTGREGRP